MTKYIKIIVEGPPKNVLVETDEGQVIELGSWSYSEEKSAWELRIPVNESALIRHLIKDGLKKLTTAPPGKIQIHVYRAAGSEKTYTCSDTKNQKYASQ